MLSFVKLGCLNFCRSGHPVVTADQFLDFVGHSLHQENFLDLPRITGRDLQEVARAKKATAGGLDGWAWNEVKALSLPWFSGLALLLELVESTGTWPQGLLDAYFAMIPKADGDSTPFGQRSPQCAPCCGTEHLCGGNNPLSLVVVGVSARTFLSLWACAARLPFRFSSWNFGDDSPCFMPVRQVFESRYHDFLRRSSQQCSAVQFTTRVGARLLCPCRCPPILSRF